MSKYLSWLYKHNDTPAPKLAKLFHAAGHPIRIRILRNIAKRGTFGDGRPKHGPGCTMTQAGVGLGLGMPTLNHHISILEKAGYIRTERHGRERLCWIKNGVSRELETFLVSLSPRRPRRPPTEVVKQRWKEFEQAVREDRRRRDTVDSDAMSEKEFERLYGKLDPKDFE